MSEIHGSYERLAEDPRWALTQRVAHSEVFRRSPRLRSFLLYVVEQSLGRPGEELNEYQIGTHVFGRPESFNPAEESIVRSSARQLRAKLQEYFEGEGRKESTVLVIPKGTYVPEFERRRAGASVLAGGADGGRKWKLAAAVLGVACLVLGWMVLRGPEAGGQAREGLVFAVFPREQGEIRVVLCDSALVVVNGFRSAVVSVEEYARRVEQEPLPLPAVKPGGATPGQFPGGRLITSFRDAAFLAALEERGAPAGYRFEARHSRLVQSRDFRSGDHILLGSTWSNPWTALFEERLNFRFEKDESGRFGIRNRGPRRGEEPFYFAPAEQGRSGVSWARVSLGPNLSGSGRVLLISGLHTESSEGATEAALSGEFLKSVEAAAGGRPLGGIKSFELLLEVRAVDGTVRGQRLVAARFTE